MSSDSVVITVKMVSGTSEGSGGLVHFNGGVELCHCGLMHATDGKYVVYEQNGKLTRECGSMLRHYNLYAFHIWIQPRDDARQYPLRHSIFIIVLMDSFFPFGDEYQMETANFRGDMIGIYTIIISATMDMLMWISSVMR